jgi:type IV pilus assembly protein PilC
VAAYVYTARRLDGTSVTGSIPADDERAALIALDRQGLFPLDLRREDGPGRASTKTTSTMKAPSLAAAGSTARIPTGAAETPGPRAHAPGATTRFTSSFKSTGRMQALTSPGAAPPEDEAPPPVVASAVVVPPAAPDAAPATSEGGLAPWLEALAPILRPSVGAETVARFARELADLSAAGVPILRAIDTISHDPVLGEGVIWGAKDAKDDQRARALFREVRRDIAQGAGLAQALGRQPDLFPDTSISLVRAGEAGGFLDAALRRVATFAERELALKRKVKAAMTYPALLGTLSVGAVIFLLSWVVPRFAVIYADLGGALPWPTRFLMGAGDLVRNKWWLLLLVLGAAGVALARALSNEAGRRTVDAILLRAPLMRRIIGQACVARFCRTLGTLLTSGVPILTALEIAQGASGNREFAARLVATLGDVREGAALVAPLRASRLFPPQVLEMVEVGQETGTLADVLERAGERADEDVDQALRIFVSILEPTLVVGVAAVVFFVVLAALLPVFSLNQMVH